MSTAGLFVFYYFAVASVASALLAVTRRRPIHSLLWVLCLFLHVAGIFLMMGAELLAAVQVIVYAGAILIFYLFFLMLLDLPSEVAAPRFSAHWPLSIVAGFAFASLVWHARDLAGSLVPPPAGALAGSTVASESNLRDVGSAIFTELAVPFEVLSLVLLAAIVGAVVMAKRKTNP
jgi:NADH-quinone oxidoreductase subunit J